MTTFQTTNVGLGLSTYPTEATTPTTPRAPIHPPPPPPPPPQQQQQQQQQQQSPPSQATSALVADNGNVSAPVTPTNATFSAVTGQRPLPTSPFASSFPSPPKPAVAARTDLAHHGDSHRSVPSAESQDVEMEEEDEEDVGSDADSVDAEGRPSKKKKGQRFFCTDFPPCKLSFTRSEHLARHIRKHTGERPFQCHCSRRFSRLDNLRQHAQTVHVNEEIPGDSLAATGTRFQRQIRTDRVAGTRPTASRPRTGAGPHSRGHSRNLSASSVGSMASTASTVSTLGRDDGRRRPPPLMMANDPGGRHRLSLDVLRSGPSTPPGQGTFFRDESEGVSTPTSTTFSTGQNSPGGYGSSMGSPTSAVSRGGFWDGRTHGRRLSVPSGPQPFQSPQITYGSPYLSPLHSSNASNFSSLSSTLGSPTSSTWGLTQQHAVSREEEWRRRTWHPSSYTNLSRPATSGMAYIHTPSDPRPSFATGAAAAASHSNRLPGIETFDQIPRRPATPPAYGATAPTHIDHAGKPPVYPGPSSQQNSGPNDRMARASWDMGLHHNLTKLELSSAPAPPEARPYQPTGVRPASEQMTQATYGPYVSLPPEAPKRPTEDDHYPTPSSNRAKRQGWYAGPPSANQQLLSSLPRTSPGDSSSSEGQPTTPSLSTSEHVPAIVHSNGYVEAGYRPVAGPPQSYPTSIPQQSPWPLPAEPTQRKDTEMSGLDALVAVATREETSTAAPHA